MGKSGAKKAKPKETKQPQFIARGPGAFAVFTPKRGGAAKISAKEAADRARQSERDKQRAQAGAFRSSTHTLIHTVAQSRSQATKTPHGVCEFLIPEAELEALGLNAWDTPVIEIKRLDGYVTFEDEPFGLIHTCQAPGTFEFKDGSTPLTSGHARLVSTKSALRRCPIAWEKGEYKLEDFRPLLLLDMLSDDMLGKKIIIELTVQWRVKGM